MSNITKKIVTIVTALTISLMMTGPVFGLTADELAASIAALQAQLAALTAQLAALQGAAPAAGAPAACTGITFDRNLKLGMTGTDVKCLQALLNTDAATKVADSGAGSPGSETTYFGSLTQAAVVKYQEKYAADCLTPLGLTTGTGFVGVKTRAKLNSVLAVVTPPAGVVCGNGTCETGETTANCPADCPAVPVAGLTVALAANTPAAQLVPSGIAPLGAPASNVPFTKVTFTGSGKISKIVVTRSGISTDASLTGIRLFDGSTQIGTTQTFNAVHQAVFNLTTPWEVSGTKTLTIAGDYLVGNTGQVILSIQSAADIVADVTVTGTFPIVGNPTTGSPTNVGSLTVDNGSLQPIAGSTVDVDATNHIFMQMRLTAGAVEDVYVNAVTVARGTAATFIDADLTNITLYNDTTGVALGTVTSLGAGSKTTFALSTPLLIARGRFVELSVRADVLGGSNRRVAFDVNDGLAYTINATGTSYGYGVAFLPGTFAGINAPWTVINLGMLNVSRGVNCPATGNVSVGGTDIKLGSLNFKVRGEDIRIARIILTVNAAGTAANIANELTMFKLVDSSGNVLAGPVNANAVAALPADTVSFTTQITLKPGDNELFVVANISAAAPNGATYQVGFGALGGNPAVSMLNQVRGMTSNLLIVPTPPNPVLGNWMTALRGALTAGMTATPIESDIIIGAQKAILGYINLDATASGEDVRVTSITINHRAGLGACVFGGGAANCTVFTDVSDLELWDGSTQVGLTMQPTADAVTFTLTTPLVVSKGSVKTLALKANLIAGTAGRVHQYQILVATPPTATTVTGAPVVVGAVGTWSPGQRLQAQGDLRVTVQALPGSAQLLAGETALVAKYKLEARFEDVSITQVGVWGATPATAGSDIATLSLWDSAGTTQYGASVPVTAGAASAINIPAGALTVPKAGSVTVSLKVTFNSKASLTSNTVYQFGIADVAVAANVDPAFANNNTSDNDSWGQAADTDTGYAILATGLSSGLPIPDIDGTWTAAAGTINGGNVMRVFDGKLTVALSSGSPSGTQTGGTKKEVLRLDLTANGDDITINDMNFIVGGALATPGVGGAGNLFLENSTGTVVYALWNNGDADMPANGYLIPATELDVLNAAGADAICGAAGWTTPLVIPAGETVTVYLRGNTSSYTTNDTLSVTLGTGTVLPNSGIRWYDVETGPTGVDLATTATTPIYGNTLRY